ncbi:MAG: CoA-binding protein [Denitrovibrio sp.]|nr:MAG: CoA-binding protein [Denitrovibrio sp.]
MQNLSDEQLIKLFKDSKTIAVVGASNKPERASNHIMKFLMEQGYDVTPVTPIEKEVLGKKTYDSVDELPFEPDIVDVFRQSAFAPEIVREAIGKNAKLVWLQETVVSKESAQMANISDVAYIEDKCILKEYKRLGLDG